MDRIQKGNSLVLKAPCGDLDHWVGPSLCCGSVQSFVRGYIFLNASFMHFHCLTVGGSNVQQRAALCQQREENMDVNNRRFSDSMCPCLVGYICCRLSATAISLTHKQ